MGMSQEKKIVVIHTSLVSRDLLMSLFQEHIPGISIYNIVDESLLAEVSSAGCVTEGVQSRMNAYVQQAAFLARRKIMCKRYSTKSRIGAVKTEQNGGCIPCSPLVPEVGAVCAPLAA